ncbi:MAG: pilus (MSHA type) biogenesis protein MshL [Deltaproteobacteria bacterium RIFOXYD12_FULL_55_16]|nr:MAG: pilus (MSHA type) biogenesis protein MshL [Deltaproteobacteria bacterium RIFOXYD12_FULL_55_16]
MKKKTQNVAILFAWAVLCLLLNTVCASAVIAETTPEVLAVSGPAKQVKTLEEGQLPVRFQKPVYMLGEASGQMGVGNVEGLAIPVGADISSNTGPVALRDIMKRLAALKGMNISWASDVDQMVEVDVDIRAEDDFFKALDNILRQKDYFHEVQGNTIVVKYRETKKFHVAMPFLKSSYATGVGGDVLGGGSTTSGLKGNIQLTSDKNDFDIWENIRKNIDQMLEIWEETVPPPAPAATGSTSSTSAASPPPTAAATIKRNVQAGKGYYSIDKPIGLITVTAPRPLVEKIAVYLDNLKTELYRQISIEAKIVEVSLEDTESRGINWSSFMTGKGLGLTLFGTPAAAGTATATSAAATSAAAASISNGFIYDPNRDLRGRGVSNIAITGSPFSLALNFLDTQGQTSVLANPKLSVMNGQPGLITAGDSVKYIDKIESRIDGTTGAVTYTITTATLMSGIGMSVLGIIMDNDEIILTLTPVTSKLDGDTVAYETIGGDNKIGVPRIKLREMNTTVRIKSGQVVVIGGLIDNAETTDGSNKVPFLGDIPVLGKLFSHSAKSTRKNELVIMLQPKIL